MNPFRRPRSQPTDSPANAGADGLWADTLPSHLIGGVGPGRGPAPLPTAHPMSGVEVDELESQTVFDQFFGSDASFRR